MSSITVFWRNVIPIHRNKSLFYFYPQCPHISTWMTTCSSWWTAADTDCAVSFFLKGIGVLFPARFIFTWTKLWEPPKGTVYKNWLKKERKKNHYEPSHTKLKNLWLDHFFRVSLPPGFPPPPPTKKSCFISFSDSRRKGLAQLVCTPVLGSLMLLRGFHFHFGLHNNYIRTAVYSNFDNQILTGNPWLNSFSNENI